MVTRSLRHRQLIPGSGLKVDVGGLVRDLGGSATHDACQRLDASIIADHHIRCAQGALGVVEGLELLPLGRGVHAQAAGDLVGVKRVHRLAGQQHDVVGHVRCRVDRADAGKHQLTLHPERRLGLRVNALNLAQTEALRLRICLQRDRDQLALRRRDCGHVNASNRGVLGYIAVLQVKRRGNLAGQATSGQRVTAIRSDIDVKDGVGGVEEGACVVAKLEALRQTIQRNDPLAFRSEPKLRGRSHHAVGDVVIGLARRDLEATRQHRTRKRHNNYVAFFEVAGATDNALQLTSAIGLANVHLAVTNRLLETRQLFNLSDAA